MTQSRDLAHPLSKEDLKELENGKAKIRELKAGILKAKQANLPVDDLESAVNALEQRILALQRTYGTT